jgi:hypothetical protein
LAVTATSLKANHPEFGNATDSLVTNMIGIAETKNDETVLGNRYDSCVEYYACHLLANSPMGMKALLTDTKNKDKYYKEWVSLAMSSGQAYDFWS